jgi:hypothetical protein
VSDFDPPDSHPSLGIDVGSLIFHFATAGMGSRWWRVVREVGEGRGGGRGHRGYYITFMDGYIRSEAEYLRKGAVIHKAKSSTCRSTSDVFN